MIETVHRNIKSEPLIRKIKGLEQRLEVLTRTDSIQLDVDDQKELQEEQVRDKRLSAIQAHDEHVSLLRELLRDFTELLKKYSNSNMMLK